MFGRIRTYEHEALWGKALATYDLHTGLPDITRQVGIVKVSRSGVGWGRVLSLTLTSSLPLAGPAEFGVVWDPGDLSEGPGE